MMRFFDMLFPPRKDELLLRGVSPEAFAALVRPLPIPATRPETIILLPFHEPMVRAAIHEVKYHGSDHAARLLAAALTHYLSVALAPDDTIVLPVPLSHARYSERGFNQVLEVLQRARCPSTRTDLLIRTRNTESQVSLSREAREENMRGAFRATHPLDPTKTYLLVDDVLTTGATLQAGIDALRASGAKTILSLAFAH